MSAFIPRKADRRVSLSLFLSAVVLCGGVFWFWSCVGLLREVEDVSGVQSLVGLSDLNLAFNRIRTLRPLSPLTELRYLNLMHNNVKSLRGIEELKGLRVLKVSDNQVRSLAPLSALVDLEELWVHNNDISTIREVDHLEKLTKLTHLWLLPNQCCGKLPPTEYR